MTTTDTDKAAREAWARLAQPSSATLRRADKIEEGRNGVFLSPDYRLQQQGVSNDQVEVAARATNCLCNVSLDHKESAGTFPVEPFVTYKQAAAALNFPIHQIRRSAKRGDFPTYTLFNARKFVRLSEVIAFIERSRTGGQA